MKPSTSSSHRSASSTKAGHQGLAIIVEDDVPLATSTAKLLMAFGYRCTVHHTPDGFLAAGEPAEPACLLLDVNLDHAMDGYQVHKEISGLGWVLPVIFVTAENDIGRAVRSLHDGAEDFITKPYDPASLVDAVGKAIAKARQLRERKREAAALEQHIALLSRRERDVARLAAQGMQNSEIAEAVRIAVATVKAHRANAFDKLGVRNATELANTLRDTGLVL